MVTEEMLKAAWAAIVGDDIAEMCHQASIVREDMRAALQAAIATRAKTTLFASEEHDCGEDVCVCLDPGEDNI